MQRSSKTRYVPSKIRGEISHFIPRAFAWVLVLAGLCSTPGWADSPCPALPPASAPDFQAALQAFLDNNCYGGWTHDPQVRTTNGVHPNVQVFYSPSLWEWMTAGKRQGDAPEAAMLVKAQYGDPAHPDQLTDWAIMVKDQTGSWDGWYWADLAPSASQVIGNPPPPPPNGPNCAKAELPYSGFGQYCINCHASAADGQDTFATTRFVLGGGVGLPLSDFPPEDSIHYRLSHMQRLGATPSDAACMIPEQNDHVVAGAKPLGPQKFVTSDQCTGCHNATASLTPARPDLPSMLFYTQQSPLQSVNLSPNGEWRFSMMGLAGRDPIFFSQLSSEMALHDNLRDHPGQGKEFVQDLCLHCHGVMGQRQFHDESGGKFFTRDQLQDPNSTYGALGRDGISCTVCHRIAPDGLGTPATYTGNFKLNSPNEMNGPYSDPLLLPMKNALGMTPQQGDQITSSKLCGSCHTIILPVYRANGEPVKDKNGQPKTFVEQATFFEWLNSDFADNGPTPQSCQDCHMPTTFVHNGMSNPLSYKIANIEDNTFPAVDYRAPDTDITLQTRDNYHRHTLLGINVFALEMFKQFRTELGLYDKDPMMRPSLNTVNGVDTAIDMSANNIAKLNTAEVKVLSVTRLPQQIQIDVQVTNKAGHSFPSGVGFRRAFLNLQVIDKAGAVVWASGNVAQDNPWLALKGLLVNGAGRPLHTEIFTPEQQRFQQHYWRENPITRQDQVQIYEELVTNPEGLLTTSFVALNRKVKDNRLQPRGWSTAGPEAEETGPVDTCVTVGGAQRCDPQYEDGSGSNVVRYLVPLNARTKGAVTVNATLYYQTIPPYYQLQRRTDATGLD
ncbi:MAG: hypothetical protein JOZ45_10050, partial [Acidobacteriaceae bacterium]|nr:hypothetical protein [Acidobacteriaceae bacterium]